MAGLGNSIHEPDIDLFPVWFTLQAWGSGIYDGIPYSQCALPFRLGAFVLILDTGPQKEARYGNAAACGREPETVDQD